MNTKTKAAATAALTYGERCRHILGSNWLAQLNTIKADAENSKHDIHTSKAHYIFKRGKPYIWVPEEDMHNTLPSKVALAGDIIPLGEDTVQKVTECLRESVISEHERLSQASYPVSSLLNSASINCISRGESLQEIVDNSENYAVYKFNIRSCTFVDGGGGPHDVEFKDVDAPKVDPLLTYPAKIINGINQNQARRRALMLFCFQHYSIVARDALMLAIDRNDSMCLAKSRNPEETTIRIKSMFGRSSDSRSKKKRLISKHSAAVWLKWKKKLLTVSKATADSVEVLYVRQCEHKYR